jgi:hypothetical protein
MFQNPDTIQVWPWRYKFVYMIQRCYNKNKTRGRRRGKPWLGLSVPTLSKRPTRRKPVQTASRVIHIPTIQHSPRHQFLSLSVPPSRNADRNCTALSAPSRRMRMQATIIQGCKIRTDTIRNHAVADLNNLRSHPKWNFGKKYPQPHNKQIV